MSAINKNSIIDLKSNEKILLALLPFWDSLIPPIGIGCLKSYLVKHGFNIKTADATVDPQFRDYYDRYFALLKAHVPENKQGNFLSVGHDILRNHMIAHMKYIKKPDYLKLLKLLVYKTFYVEVSQDIIIEMHHIVDRFYQQMEEYMIELLEKEKPAILGLSVFSNNLPTSMFAFKVARENHPNIKTVMGGGVFADQLDPGSENMEIFLQETQSYIDHLIVGEGELLLKKLLNNELPSSQRVFTFNDINRTVLDLSTTDAVDMSDFDLQNYPYIVSYASRSCPFQCSFCSETIQWGKYRKKPAKKVFQELTQMYEKYGSQLYLLTDSLLNPVLEDLSEEFLQANTTLYWEGWLRVDRQICDLNNTLRLRKSGFYHARLGIESGSLHVLELMGKKITLDQIKASISALAYSGIKTTTLWVVGHPGETEEDFQQTLDLLEELKSDIYEAECRPFYFYPTGQSGSDDDWWKNTKKIPLYPVETKDMLLFQTWLLDCEPSREVSYQRMNRFTQHCKNLGIPNPYSMHDIYEADERWKKLQKNAVPALVEFKNTNNYINECKNINKIKLVQIPDQESNLKDEYLNFGF